MTYILAFVSILIACGILIAGDWLWRRYVSRKRVVSYAEINRERITITHPNTWLADFFERD